MLKWTGNLLPLHGGIEAILCWKGGRNFLGLFFLSCLKLKMVLMSTYCVLGRHILIVFGTVSSFLLKNDYNFYFITNWCM